MTKKSLTVAILADVHGNYLALKACLDYIRDRHIEYVLFLGDYITDHPYPQRVMELLYAARDRYKSNCRFIRGNREDYMISYRQAPSGWRDGPAQGALLYCYENLLGPDIDWFESLPISGSWQIEAGSIKAPAIGFCHGSPEAARSEMRGDAASLELLGRQPEDIIVKGHNHRQWGLCHRGKRLVCAGSVGNPIWRRAEPGGPKGRELAGTAGLMLLHLRDGRWVPEYLDLPYDWQGAIENLRTSGLRDRAPIWADMLRHNILTGEDPFGILPVHAANFYRQETGIEAGWPDVPLEYWERAARLFGVETEW